MKIAIKQDRKTLKKSIVENLPDFTVITGENGSGKTQLLIALSGQQNPGEEIIDSRTGQLISLAELHIESGIAKKINYVPVQGNHIHLGHNINSHYLVNNYGKLPLRYYSFLNLKMKTPNKVITTKELDTQFKLDIGVNSNNARNYNSNIRQSDINLFEIIYSRKKNKNEPTTINECIINTPVINNNLFSTNLTLLYLQHKCKIELGYEIKETPWEVFNTILEEAEFKYRLNPPNLLEENSNISAKLIDTENGNIIDINELSSGEKTIMSLILALYNSNNDTEFPQVILFDEPDSSLHPSMTKQMLDVLQNVFIKEKNVKVILTTHSPSTVALSPELSIYRMDREIGHLVKESKSQAINNLTVGLDNLSIYYENRKQIFVESSIDKYFYEVAYVEIRRQGLLNKNINLEFITMSEKKITGDENGGCDFVRKIVNRLHNSGNNTTFGLIDYDNKNNASEKISVIGNNNRYSIENYILDPIFLSFILLQEVGAKKLEFGFNIEDNISNFQNINLERIQNIVNIIVEKIKPFVNSTDQSIIEYKTINNYCIKIPTWYYTTNGHNLESAILKGLYDLNSLRVNNSICKAIINKCIRVFPLMLSIDIVKTFKELEEK